MLEAQDRHRREQLAISATLKSTSLRLIAQRSESKPAHVQRLICQLPDAADPHNPRPPADRAFERRARPEQDRCNSVLIHLAQLGEI